MWNRKELKSRGRVAMRANYGKSVVAALLMSLVTAGAAATGRGKDANADTLGQAFSEASAATGIPVGALVGIVAGALGVGVIIAILIKMFIRNPLVVGTYNFFMKNADAPAELSDIVEPFDKGHFVNVWLVMLFRDLFVALWTLLFIVPGIVKSYEYRMVPYILAEDPSTDWHDALNASKRMMQGQKWAAFMMDLSFLGWHILSALTVGLVGLLYVGPYVAATNAELYLALRDRA